MLYKSTRGADSGVSFEDVLLATYASDGGLYVPDYIPMISQSQLIAWKDHSFPRVCAEIMHMYTDIEVDVLFEMAERAFSKFNPMGDLPLPITALGNLWLLDTSLGPTLSFKDIGQQMVAQLLSYYLGRRGRKACIVVETSGDTGPAAIAGVRECASAEIFCLYPNNRVSPIQELQMITVHSDNVHVYRTDGTTDDQASVLKELFEDKEFVRSNGICSINSINWARIAVQSTYYVWAYLRLFDSKFRNNTMSGTVDSHAPDASSIGVQEVVFCVPTGAFGNAMGGFVAKQMGVPIHRIICATNANDIVHRCLTTGDLSMGSNIETFSPAMDIQFAYNLERMLYYICNQNPVAIKTIMTAIDRQFAFIEGSQGVTLDPIVLNKIKDIFVSCSVSDERTLETISSVRSSASIELCPHSAIGVYAARELFAPLTSQFPTFCVLTANASKFEETFKKATEHSPHLREDVVEMRLLPVKFSKLEKTSSDSSWREKWIGQLKSDILSRMAV